MAVHYRIIQYEGPQDWIDRQLDHSIHGEKRINCERVIRVADIEPDAALTIAFCRNKIRALTARVTEIGIDELKKFGEYECVQSVCEGMGKAGSDCRDCAFMPAEAEPIGFGEPEDG